jgi:uncharacterized RDD family membrane protein YckC
MSACYEGVVLFGVVVFFGYAFSALTQFRGEPGALRWGFQAFLFLVVGTYFTWFWSDGRRTLPMKTVAVRLVDRDDRPTSPTRAALRYLACAVMLLVPVTAGWYLWAGWLLLLPIPFLWTLFDRERRALYDRIAGTRLVLDAEARP